MKVPWRAIFYIINIYKRCPCRRSELASSKLGHSVVSWCLGVFQNCDDREGINIRRGTAKTSFRYTMYECTIKHTTYTLAYSLHAFKPIYVTIIHNSTHTHTHTLDTQPPTHIYIYIYIYTHTHTHTLDNAAFSAN